MSLLASCAFVIAVIVVIAAVRITIVQYGSAALRNVAALRACDTGREFRVKSVSVVVRPSVSVTRMTVRASQPRRISSQPPLRAAA